MPLVPAFRALVGDGSPQKERDHGRGGTECPTEPVVIAFGALLGKDVAQKERDHGPGGWSVPLCQWLHLLGREWGSGGVWVVGLGPCGWCLSPSTVKVRMWRQDCLGEVVRPGAKHTLAGVARVSTWLPPKFFGHVLSVDVTRAQRGKGRRGWMVKVLLLGDLVVGLTPRRGGWMGRGSL